MQVKSTSESQQILEPQPSTSGYIKGNNNSKDIYFKKEESLKEICSTKQLKWDKTILETLVSILNIIFYCIYLKFF